MISFHLPGKPRGKGRPRFYNGRVIPDPKTVGYERYVAEEAKLHFLAPLDGPVHLDIIAKFKVPDSWSERKKRDHYGQSHTQKPDIDNIEKIVMDGLTGIAWHDDKQVAFSVTEKLWGKTEGLYVIVKPHESEWKSVSEASQKTLDEIFELRCQPQLNLFEAAE